MLTLAQLAEHLNGVWHGNASHAIFSFASLTQAASQDLAYFDNSLPRHILDATSAGVVLLKAEHLPGYKGNALVVAHPLESMRQAITLLSLSESLATGIHPTAAVHPSAQIAKDVSIGAYSVIGEHVHLASGVRIAANTVIESAVSIGENSHIASQVVIHSGCRLGAEVVVNSGSVLGGSPFNYIKHHGSWVKEPVVGTVVLANGVHLGANTVIDRGTLNDTYVGVGVCIDNLVQIAHDVVIGNHTLIAGCAAIGAYAHIGSDCIIGGASSIAAYVNLVDDVVITGMSTVSKSIAKSGIYSSGTLVHEHQRWRRNAARFRRLDDYITKFSALEKKLNPVE